MRVLGQTRAEFACDLSIFACTALDTPIALKVIYPMTASILTKGASNM